jgi:hypothetical protein
MDTPSLQEFFYFDVTGLCPRELVCSARTTPARPGAQPLDGDEVGECSEKEPATP